MTPSLQCRCNAAFRFTWEAAAGLCSRCIPFDQLPDTIPTTWTLIAPPETP